MKTQKRPETRVLLMSALQDVMKVESNMIKPKRTAAEQVEDEAARRALNPVSSRQAISDSQAEPEFQQNHLRLKADRIAREAQDRAKKTSGENV